MNINHIPHERELVDLRAQNAALRKVIREDARSMQLIALFSFSLGMIIGALATVWLRHG